MFLMLFVYRRIVTRGSYVTITGKAFRPRAADVGRLRYVLFGVCMLYLMVAVVLPIATLLYASVQKIAVAFPAADNFTLDNFRAATSMNAAVPPVFCASAIACNASVVLPLDSGP